MKNLHHSITELTQEEYTIINGGESGWYYLGRFAKRVVNAGKYVGGFLDGLFTGDCHADC